MFKGGDIVNQRRSIYCSEDQYRILKIVLLSLRNIDSGIVSGFQRVYGDCEVSFDVKASKDDKEKI